MHEYLREDRIVPFGRLLAPQIAGWHDGEKAAIDFDFVNNSAVFHHEQAHETIFLKTPDGILLSVLYRALDSGVSIDRKIVRRLEMTANTMFEASRVAHEVAATYLGLKMLTPAEAGVSELLLPPEYRQYYRTAADVVDPHFGSTYLQVVVLSTVAHFAFGSMLLAEFVSRDWPRYAKLKREFQPNRRLDSLLGYLADGKVADLRATLDEAADAFFTRTGHRRWDLDSEDGWTDVPAAGHLLDLALAQAVEDWLASQQLLPYLHGEQRRSAYARLKAWGAMLGLSFEANSLADSAEVAATLPPDEYRLFADEAAIAAAKRQAGSVISNPKTLRVPTLGAGEFCADPHFTAAGSLIVLDADPYDDTASWTVIASGLPPAKTNCLINGIRCLAAHVSHRDVVEWLNALAEGKEHSWKGVDPALLVLALGATNPETRAAAGRDHPGPIDSRWNDRAVFYVDGNWAKLMEVGAQLGGVEATEIHVGIRPQDAMDDPARERTIHLKIARGEAIPGKCAFRPFGGNASTAMIPLVVDWENRLEIRFLSTDDAEAAGFDLAAVVTAFGCLVAFWTCF